MLDEESRDWTAPIAFAEVPRAGGPNDGGPNGEGPRENGPNEDGPSDSGPSEDGPDEGGPNDSGLNGSGLDDSGPRLAATGKAACGKEGSGRSPAPAPERALDAAAFGERGQIRTGAFGRDGVGRALDAAAFGERGQIQTGAFGRGGARGALALRVEAFFVRHRRRILLLQLPMLALFAALVLLPALLPAGAAPGAVGAPSGVLAGFSRFASFAIWGFWFPLVFLSVILGGRSWCGLFCPMGASSEWVNRLGPKWPIPRLVRWPGTPILSFVVVTIWAQTAGARDHPLGDAIVFGAIFAFALLIGFFFGRKKRAWCRHLCPIGLLLGVYSRLGALEFRPKRPEPGGDRWSERGVCPTMIDLDRKTESRHCIACYRCVSPQAKGGLALRLRTPGEEVAAIRQHHPNLSEVLFLFIGAGAGLGGFLWLVLPFYQTLRRTVGDWAIGHGWYWIGNPGPVWLMANYPAAREVFRWLDFLLIAGFMLTVTLIATIVMGGASALAAWLSGRLGGERGFRERFLELGYQFLPVAMVSLLLGLGSKLFAMLALFAIGGVAAAALKAALFAGGYLWSLALGERLLARQGLSPRRRWLAMLPGVLASTLLGAAWIPAVF